MMHQTLRKLRGFTLVEIMIVVAILGLLIAIGVPGFLTARNKGRVHTAIANLKAINDNIANYGVNEADPLDSIIRLWPATSDLASPASYIRRQLLCPIVKTSYSYDAASLLGSCAQHGNVPTQSELTS